MGNVSALIGKVLPKKMKYIITKKYFRIIFPFNSSHESKYPIDGARARDVNYTVFDNLQIQNILNIFT